MVQGALIAECANLAKLVFWNATLSCVADMSNSIEPGIDIDFLGGIGIGIDIDYCSVQTIDIGIDTGLCETVHLDSISIFLAGKHLFRNQYRYQYRRSWISNPIPKTKLCFEPFQYRYRYRN